ncbi:MAG TPA: ISAzo13 family transposase [Solirubrobacteraceae bacterium]|nr:ISAzo13 family transposase [Solirubrobacteraceae bacterium]
MVDERAIAERYRLLSQQRVLDERGRRLWAAAEARSAGRGGIAAVVRATGISESTVLRGLADLESGEVLEPGRVRRPGAGQVPILEREPGLAKDLERLVDPVTRGDPESPLRWTSKSGAKLAEALREMGHDVVDRTVLRLLKAKGYSLQANKKTREGAQHPDRDAQFAHINKTVADAIKAGQPVISVDTKKRELVGDFKAVGREFEPKGKPVEVRGHDFKDKELGHAIPYGVYDLVADEGWVSVGITRDTARFAVNSILSWWQHLGRERYPHATSLTITADSGGSNSPRTRLWRVELQRLADLTGLQIRVCHFPPGTSKWNKIEHRMFSFMSLNARGKPLESIEVIINLIAGTSTTMGLKIYAQLDDRTYEKGVEISDEQLAAVNITREAFHGEWNYAVTPSVIQS